ncbi:DoxX-like family protein [Micrococcales bacterium KH10]|nr:DoxX-like family protein [Micrococcales bacterium KH10]
MGLALWIINGVLAAAFLMAGSMKALRPKSALAAAGMAWVEGFSAGSVKLIGIAEVLGAIGLIVPRLADIAPVLTPIAAVGLLVLMIGAVAVHVKRQEPFAPALALAVLTAASAALGFIVVL